MQQQHPGANARSQYVNTASISSVVLHRVVTMADGYQAVDSGPLQDYRRLRRLYCKNGGFHLQMLPDGTVQGWREEDEHTVLKIQSVDVGVVVIQGIEARRYLAMSEDGRLYGSETVTDQCYFLEKLEENHYNTYQSHSSQDKKWFVGLKKNGKTKLGSRTNIGQKAVFFLPRNLQNNWH